MATSTEVTGDRANRGGPWAWITAGLIAGYVVLAVGAADRRDSDWSHLWLGGRMVATGAGQHLYDPDRQVTTYRAADPRHAPPAVWKPRNERLGCFNYPPPTAVAYALLAWMPLTTAAIVQAVVTLLATLLAAWATARIAGRPRCTWRWAAVMLLFPPFFANLALGQNGMITLALAVVAADALRRGQDRTAGMALALLALKPQWLLAVVWWPLVLRRWRCLLWCAVGVLGTVSATVAIIGWQPFADYAALSTAVGRLHDLPGYHLDLKYGLFGLARRWCDGGAWGTPLGFLLAGLVGSSTMSILWRSAPRRSVGPAGIGAALAAAGLLNPHLNHYDLVWTVVPVLLAWSEITDLSGWQRGRLVVLTTLTWLAWPCDAGLSAVGLVAGPAVLQVLWWAHLVERARAASPEAGAAVAVPRDASA